jgi:hypothetical protein
MRLTLRHVFAAVTFALSACSGNDWTLEAPNPGSQQKLFVELSAQFDTIPESTSKTYTARVTDQTGFLKAVPITWSSTDPNVVSVSGGNVTGVSPGVAFIIAAASGAADSAHVVVAESAETTRPCSLPEEHGPPAGFGPSPASGRAGSPPSGSRQNQSSLGRCPTAAER